MNTLNNYFDHVFCINLVNRPDRRNKMQERFNKLGIIVEWITTVEFGFADKLLYLLKKAGHDFVNPGEISCAIAHYSIIKIAKERGYKNIFILEDDCVFHKDFNELLPECMSLLAPLKWDMLFLYTMQFHDKINKLVVNDTSSLMLFSPTEAHCASSYAINHTMYDTLIDYLDNDFRIIDSRYRLLMDDPKLNIYSVFPNLCGQDIDTSNIRGDGKTKLDYFSGVTTFGTNKKEDYL